jgi:succinoglycan biosynthesis transport protein ExoP
MGLVFGCGLGMGGAVAFEHLKPSFRRPEEVEMVLGLPVIAATGDFRMAYPKGSALPQVLPEGEKTVMKRGTKEGNGSGKPGRMGRNGAAQRFLPTHNLVTKWSPLSMVSEQFRVAATRLALMVAERPHTVIVVTSAVKGEGKSATTVNLGYVLARDLGKSTVLIDGDLKNPTLHSYAAVASAPGLTDLLLGTKPLDRCVQPLGELPLWILPTGHSADRPLELSKIQQLAGILSELRTRYDYLIVDAPPILPVADMNVLAGMADLLVLVIRAGSTPRDAVQQSLNSLKAVGQVGIILTGLVSSDMPYYARRYYYAKSGTPI